MKLGKLLTLTFDRNVGLVDRSLRLISGALLMAAGWYFSWPLAASVALSVLGLMWFATGVLSRCSIYYLLGISTCPSGTRVATGPETGGKP